MLLFLFLSLLHLPFEKQFLPEKGQIKGIIMDDQTKQPLEYATVALYKSKDSSLIGGTITNAKGEFEMEALFGEYYLKIEFISYQTKIIDKIILTPDKPKYFTGSTHLKTFSTSLNEIEITGEKNQMQLSIDKKVYNVGKDLLSSGGTAQDILQNVPAVNMDSEGNVTFRGSSNVRVLIDGKPSGITAINTQSALEQLPAGAIESIEVISNPSAKYDAEGMSGIINIVLKKQRKMGLNGMINLTGAYHPDHTGTILLNYGKKRINYFGSYSLNYFQKSGIISHHREITLKDTTTFQNQDSEMLRKGLTQNGRVGAELRFNEKNTFTTSTLFKYGIKENERITTYTNLDYSRLLTNKYNRENVENENESTFEYNAGWKKYFSRKEQYLMSDLQFSDTRANSETDITENQEFPSQNNQTGLQFVANEEQQQSWIFQSDYVHPASKEGKWELGIKTNFKTIDKEYSISEYDVPNAKWFEISNYSNYFKFFENINASYVLYNNSMKSIHYKAGVRTEQTQIDSRLIESGNTYKKNYINFFPTLHLTKEFASMFTTELSYSRRIKRPSQRDINPYTSFADELNFMNGNPDINPELTHSFETGVSKNWEKHQVVLNLYYRHTDGFIQRIRTLDTNGVSVVRPENLKSQKSGGAEINLTENFTAWWTINVNVNYFYNILNGTNLNSAYLKKYFSWTGKVNSQMKIKKTLVFQFNINYNAPSEMPQGIMKAMFATDMALKKEILKGKGNVNFRISDVFNSRKHAGESFGTYYHISSEFKRSMRTFYLGITYNINKFKMKESDKREQGYDRDEGAF